MNSRDIAYHLRRKHKKFRTKMLAAALRYNETWMAHGEGVDPVLYEQGHDNRKREPSRTPRPEHRLNFGEDND
jgi:hypothetical protein